MKNDLFSIGSFTIHGYGLMIGIGFLAAYLLCDYRAKKKGLDPDVEIEMEVPEDLKEAFEVPLERDNQIQKALEVLGEEQK